MQALRLSRQGSRIFAQCSALRPACHVGIARNPQAAGKIQTPMIIALAFTEALALYGFVIGIMIVGKI